MGPTGAPNGPLSHSRKPSITSSCSGSLSRNQPTSFFIRTEAEIENITPSPAGASSNSSSSIKSLDDNANSDGNPPRESIPDNELIIDKTLDDKQPSSRILSIDTVLQAESDHIPSRSPFTPSSSNPPGRIPSLVDLSQPLTPVFTNSPLQGSAPASTTKSSSLRSFQLYDEDSNADEAASQAMTSSGEDQDEVESHQDAAEAPQFVMPSITMPSRRPFTENGKKIGKLKIVVTGERGIGKTSLIKSIIQLCEEIVHVDSLSGSLQTAQTPQAQNPRLQHGQGVLMDDSYNIEILASTRAYPDWWADVEESRIFRRRKSASETILDRNLCFIESPTVRQKQRLGTVQSPVLQVVERLLQRNASFEYLSDSEILGMMSGDGGVQVDLVIYMLSPDPSALPFDLARMKDLAQLTNVIPVIAKGDLIGDDDIENIKADVLSKMRQSQILPFMLGKSISEASLSTAQLSAPFVVSSAPSTDDDSMDASLLMSPDYVQPLIPSDLGSLVSRIFDPDTASWLRQSSSKKFLTWYRTIYAPTAAAAAAAQRATTSPLHLPGLLHPTRAPLSRGAPAPTTPTANLKWAASLQRSLANERARFAALHAADRAVWLTERLGECVRDGTLVAVRPSGPSSSQQPQLQPHLQPHWAARRALAPGPAKWVRNGGGDGGGGGGGATYAHVLDPLGLLALNERLARRGRLLVRVLGGAGVVGALTMWVARWCGWWDGDVVGLLEEWVGVSLSGD